VRAPVHAREIAGELERGPQHALAGGERVVDADADARVAVQRQQHQALGAGIEVVKQDPHLHAAIGGVQDLCREQASGQVVVPDVGLDIQAASGRTRRVAAQREGLHAVRDQPEPGGAGMPGRGGGDFRIQPGALGHRECRLVGQLGARRQLRAAGDQEQGTRQQATESGLHGSLNDVDGCHDPAMRARAPQAAIR
jgi:hypothetical protein